jgi:hypothetical protein
MASLDEQILRSAKEIVVKFIETGRVSPAAFPELFKNVYETIEGTVRPPSAQSDEPDEKDGPQKG